MRIGNSNKRKQGLASLKNIFKLTNIKQILSARLISPRLNVDVQSALELGSQVVKDLNSVKNEEDVYSLGAQYSSLRFGEQFNIPINIEEADLRSIIPLGTKDLGLSLENGKDMELPLGLFAILGGPDSGKSSLVRYIRERVPGAKLITAMEPVLTEDERYLIGPQASCLGIAASLKLDCDVIFFDSARFVRGVSDYGLGEKGLPIGVSLFLTDINNLLVTLGKRMFLVVSTESSNESYNQAYYELVRGAINGIIQPIPGEQAGYIEFRPDNRKPILYKYGSGESYEATYNIFELKTNFMLKDSK